MKSENIKSMIYYQTIFKFIVIIKRFLNGKIKSNRTYDYPFISGDAFRSIAQHIFDDISSIRPERVEEDDVIFVRTDMLNIFFNNILPQVKYSFILVTHNADNNIDEKYLKYDLTKIKIWFAQNKLVEHPKIISLPIGISNYRYKPNTSKQLKKEIPNIERKKYRILSAFNSETNPIRKIAKMELEKTRFSDHFKISQTCYLKKVGEYSFVASPEGNGVDCHRTWEALYLGAIPIVIKNAMTKELFDLGIPLLLIDSWEELPGFDEDFLRQKYSELKPGLKTEKLYIDYWFKKITNSSK